MISGIYSIGNLAFSEEDERFFAHQFGDGFVLVSDFHEQSLDRCVAIAIALMRHVAGCGCMARAAVAEGGFVDYSGCWPREIQQELSRTGESDTVRLGMGIMTLLPVMGTALINANKLDHNNSIKGSILSISKENVERLSPSFKISNSSCPDDISAVDWLHSEHPILDRIASNTGVGNSTTAGLEAAVRNYVTTQSPPPKWIAGTYEMNNL